MSFYSIGFNNMNMFGGCCCNPFSSMIAANYLYNPFMMFSAATQLMNGNFPLFGAYTYQQPVYSYFNFGNFTPAYTGSCQLPQGSLFDDIYYSFDMGMKAPSAGFAAPVLNVYDFKPQNTNGDLYQSFGTALSNRTQKSSSFPNTYSPHYTKLSGTHLTKEFLNAVKKSAKKIGCDYEDLLALMNSESSLNPSAVHKNKKGEKTAVGLIQFTKKYAIPDLNKKYNLNLTLEKIEKMSAIEQLDLVEKFYEMNKNRLPKGRKLSAADLYAVTYLPARANNDILCRKGERNRNGELLGYYEGNRGLDVNNDDKITKDDLNARLSQKRVSLSTFA